MAAMILRTLARHLALVAIAAFIFTFTPNFGSSLKILRLGGGSPPYPPTSPPIQKHTGHNAIQTLLLVAGIKYYTTLL